MTATAPTITEPAHIVTRDTAGNLRCDCKRFKVNTVLFGVGECDHTRRVAIVLSAQKAGAK